MFWGLPFVWPGFLQGKSPRWFTPCCRRPISLALHVPVLRQRPRLCVWGGRASHRELPKGDPLPAIVYFLEAALSGFCDLVIANSNAGKDEIVRRGFPAKKVLVIENGIDTERFRFSEHDRIRMRKAWGLALDHKLVGLEANIRPVKDHATFIKAASLLCKRRKDYHFVCVGGGDAFHLKKMAVDLGVGNRIIWAGPCRDMQAAYSALDILCSTSLAEGFSNVIAEAMSCGRPCVVTDVGDSAGIVRTTGTVVPTGNPEKLAAAIEIMTARIAYEPDLCQKTHLRIQENFDISVLANRTAQAIEGLLPHKARF